MESLSSCSSCCCSCGKISCFPQKSTLILLSQGEAAKKRYKKEREACNLPEQGCQTVEEIACSWQLVLHECFRSSKYFLFFFLSKNGRLTLLAQVGLPPNGNPGQLWKTSGGEKKSLRRVAAVHQKFHAGHAPDQTAVTTNPSPFLT